MPYAPYGWENDPSTDTPLEAATLEGFGAHIYNQIPVPPSPPDEVVVTAPGDPTPDPAAHQLWVEVL